jgi:hypothetical protein
MSNYFYKISKEPELIGSDLFIVFRLTFVLEIEPQK